MALVSGILQKPTSSKERGFESLFDHYYYFAFLYLYNNVSGSIVDEK